VTLAPRAMSDLSIIVPVLDEAALITDALRTLAPLRGRGVEVIVADGGSTDRTRDLAASLCDRVVSAPRGRGSQMNAGAAVARGRVLLFLHADSRLSADAPDSILAGLARSGRSWGHFDVRIDGRHPLLPVVAGFSNLRSRLTGIATGDQAIFVRRDAFAAAGGFPEIALMEDIAFSRRMKRVSPALCLPTRTTTSGRRWDERGLLRTVLLMWRLRLAYFLGATPDWLARAYGYAPTQSQPGAPAPAPATANGVDKTG
jgi:rSAM/selenodomain-associated transferase 2